MRQVPRGREREGRCQGVERGRCQGVERGWRVTSGFSSLAMSAKMRTRPGMAPRMTVWKETERSVSPAFEAPMSSAVMTPMAIESRRSLLAGAGVDALH